MTVVVVVAEDAEAVAAAAAAAEQVMSVMREPEKLEFGRESRVNNMAVMSFFADARSQLLKPIPTHAHGHDHDDNRHHRHHHHHHHVHVARFSTC